MTALSRNGLRVLDLFCCQGGAGMGYHLAGFDVTGIDTAAQPRYPFTFVQADALEYLAAHGSGFDLIHASPPCQRYTRAQQIRGREHPDLIEPLRDLLLATGRPYVIENVPGAPLLDPVELCGAMFGLRTYRHRRFETSFPLPHRHHPRHLAPSAKMGRPVRDGEYLQVVGNFSGVALARTVMGMPWANRDGLREAVPPAYTRHIAAQFLTNTGPAVAV
ncbi:DNA cytosine methyltransferase [Actinacidiphila glaucinigra]|uniref:DNA (Cytosine-5)-methyltransferase 1 n=1 Tax=Actinacidiphila glaucinigra TaxID=235986 RepID=A0A239HDA3_9ACTN|nr:DNA cytosine methyltransferase [Actinacidiphila glaucinigra]SNS79115.1 DNA (cytosine-5)-methyltransferase 1 [Actinacidiphila glaucinigra]